MCTGGLFIPCVCQVSNKTIGRSFKIAAHMYTHSYAILMHFLTTLFLIMPSYSSAFRKMLNPLIESKKISGALVIAVPSGKYRYTPAGIKEVFVLICPG